MMQLKKKIQPSLYQTNNFSEIICQIPLIPHQKNTMVIGKDLFKFFCGRIFSFK